MSSIYRELAEIPIPTAARFVGENVVQATFSARDHLKNVRRTTTKTYFLASESKIIPGPNTEVSNVILSSPSPSGEHLAVLKEEPDQDGKKKRLVQVWKGDALEAELDVTEKHGAFYGDDYFSSLSFSPSGNTLVYTAEENPTTSSFDDEDPFKEFTFTPKLGEGLPQRRKPRIFLLRWSPGSAVDIKPTVEGLKYESETYLGQATFTTDDNILAIGYDRCGDGRLLGVKGCLNHPSAIWEITPAETQFEEGCTLTKHDIPQRTARSPRVLKKDGATTVFWLSSGLGGGHASCSSLHSLDVQTSEKRTVLEDVQAPTSSEQFPGLYPESFNLPSQPFLQLKDTSFIAVSSSWGSRNPILLIDTKSSAVRNITPDGDYHWSVLGTDGKNRILASRSSLVEPTELLLGVFSEEGKVSWTSIVKPSLSPSLQESLHSLEMTTLQIPNRHPMETILLRKSPQKAPKGTGLPPLISVPHGGPHACVSVGFNPGSVARALEGYTVSFPNYTGSTGYGQKFVDGLRGKVGSLDVEDCMASIRHLIDLKIAQEGPGKQVIEGGSHGGFLAAHLIGQYPGFFSAAAMRNPVIDMGSPSTSDILDWFYAESDLPFSFDNPPASLEPAIYEKLWNASPIAHAHKVETPVLLLIGTDDQRVPPIQGMSFYHALKARKQDVKMLCFPGEGHPLDGVRTARVAWEAQSRHFAKYVVF